MLEVSAVKSWLRTLEELVQPTISDERRAELQRHWDGSAPEKRERATAWVGKTIGLYRNPDLKESEFQVDADLIRRLFSSNPDDEQRWRVVASFLQVCDRYSAIDLVRAVDQELAKTRAMIERGRALGADLCKLPRLAKQLSKAAVATNQTDKELAAYPDLLALVRSEQQAVVAARLEQHLTAASLAQKLNPLFYWRTGRLACEELGLIDKPKAQS